jgi:type II secretory ATPase GspE/PulE/Tfp pilus assembly ATPase PilB-like protein
MWKKLFNKKKGIKEKKEGGKDLLESLELENVNEIKGFEEEGEEKKEGKKEKEEGGEKGQGKVGEKEKKKGILSFLPIGKGKKKKEEKGEDKREIGRIIEGKPIEEIIEELPLPNKKKGELLGIWERIPKSWEELLEELIKEFNLKYNSPQNILKSANKQGIPPIVYITQILKAITEDELLEFYEKKYGLRVDKLFSPIVGIRKLNSPNRIAVYLIGDGGFSRSEIGLYAPMDLEIVIKDLARVYLSGQINKELEKELEPLKSLNLEDLEIVIVSSKLFENKDLLKEKTRKEATDLRQKFKNIIKVCMQNDVSDVHFSPKSSFVEVKVRLYGDLVPFMHLTHPEWQAMMRVIKTMASESGSIIDVNEWRIGQDAKATIPEFNVDLRLAFTPSLIEKEQYLVIRVLYRGKELRIKKGEEVEIIRGLGYFDEDAEFLAEYITTKEKGQGGILIMSGATASGKSKTLNTLLALIPPKRAIKTVEDPVEYRLANADQHEVMEFTKGDQTIEFGFLQAVKEFMRQDPDIIFIGEWRKDKELTGALTYASKTGHFVLTTLHSSRIVNIPDLLYSDYGVDQPTQANNISLLISQRLLKTVCPNCALVEPVKYTDLTMEIDKIPFLDNYKLFRIFDVFRNSNVIISLKNNEKTYIKNLKKDIYIEEKSLRKLFIKLSKDPKLEQSIQIDIPEEYKNPIESFKEIKETKRMHQVFDLERYKKLLSEILKEEILMLGKLLEKDEGELDNEEKERLRIWKILIEEKEFKMDTPNISPKIKEKIEKGQKIFRVVNLEKLWKYYFEYVIERNPKINQLREMVIYYSPKVNEKGCDKCRKENPITGEIIVAGIKGRTPIYEYLFVDTDFRELIFRTTEALEIEKLLNKKNREYIRTKTGKLFPKGKSFIDTFSQKLVENYNWNIPISELIKLKQ